MAPDPDKVALLVVVEAAPGVEADDLDEAARSLLAEVRELEIESAEMAPGDAAPAGAKSAGAFSAGALLLTCLPAAIPKLLDYLQRWKTRRPDHLVKIRTQAGDRTVEIEFAPGSISLEQMKGYVDLLTEKVGSSGSK
jgi:hypothetical protein